jgi:hypothetical protein
MVKKEENGQSILFHFFTNRSAVRGVIVTMQFTIVSLAGFDFRFPVLENFHPRTSSLDQSSIFLGQLWSRLFLRPLAHFFRSRISFLCFFE